MRLDILRGMAVSNVVAIASMSFAAATLLAAKGSIVLSRQYCWRCQSTSLKFIDSGFALERCYDGAVAQF